MFNPRHDDDGNDDNDVDDECLVILEFHFIVMVLPVYTCCSELIIVPPTKASHSVSVSFCLPVFLSVLLYFGLLLWETGPQINIQNNGRCHTSTAPMEQKRYISILFVWISLNIHKKLFIFCRSSVCPSVCLIHPPMLLLLLFPPKYISVILKRSPKWTLDDCSFVSYNFYFITFSFQLLSVFVDYNTWLENQLFPTDGRRRFGDPRSLSHGNRYKLY